MFNLAIGQQLEGSYVITRKEVLPFRDQERGSYLALTLQNRWGQIQGRLWELPENHGDYCPGKVVSLRAVPEEYQCGIQLRILDIRLTREEDIDLSQLVPSSSRPSQEMEEELNRRIAEIQDTQLNSFLREWFEEPHFQRLFTTAPAAKQIHHPRLGGLLEHSLEVVTLGLAMARLYGADQAMVTAGALLHDVGKIYEYTWLPVLDLSDHGRLMGHIALGYQLLQERGKDLNGEKLLHLGHIILSHHGEIEFGSPVRPQTLEAMIVHEADLASGRLRAAADALDQGEELWTSWQKGLSRSLFRGFR